MAGKTANMAPDPVQHSLDVLWTMTTAVLVQSAKVFRDPTKHDDKNVLHTNAQMKQVIPGALGRFHGALDVLEIEILRAKAIMSRDLTEARARRLTREREATAQQTQGAAHVEPKGVDGVQDILPQPSASLGAAQKEKLDDKVSESEKGVVIPPTDTSTKAETITRLDLPAPPPNVTASVPLTKPAASIPAPVDATHDQKAVTEANPIAADTVQDLASVNSSAIVNMTASVDDSNKMDLDTTFGDTSGAGASNTASNQVDQTMNFNLDFSGDPAQSNSDSVKAGDATKIDGVAHMRGGSDEMAALLPGLESYANASNDDIDLAGMTGDHQLSTSTAVDGMPATSAPADPGSMNFDLNNSNPMVPAEATDFDDLFFSTDDIDLAGSGDKSGDASGAHMHSIDGSGGLNFDDGTGGNGGEFDDAMFGI